MATPLWSPTTEQIAQANLTAFARLVEERWSPGLQSYADLYRWSLDEAARFWETVWSFTGIVSSRRWDSVVEDYDRLPGARWFTGARLNFAENLLRHRDDRPAIIAACESGGSRTLTFRELYGRVARVADAWRRAGIQPGDRVAGYLPNVPEAVIAMLAAASLGAVWTSCSPDFGTAGVLDRFGQIAPRVLVAAEGYTYSGRQFSTLERVAEIAGQLDSLEHLILVPPRADGPSDSLPGALQWRDLIESSRATGIEFAQLPFDHPLYILYSSGTTGVPKCIVHSAGGTLLQHQKEHVLHVDLRPDDRLFYYTTTGWMMWNWLVSGLAVGSAIVLYDGSPLAPKPDVLFDLVDRHAISVFGTSPKFLSAAEKEGVKPARTHRLSSLRSVLSTGAPLTGGGFDYVYRDIKPDVHLANLSGGTDICSCFALGNPISPVYRGEMQTRGLGMKVLVYDDAGRPVRGEKGELVCAAPFPSLPLGFWNDPEGERYRRAYFERFPGVWWHGDFAELTEHDGLIIYGRSDAVLNPGGVRIGTAEIYRQVERSAEVLESVAVAQQWEGDVRIVLFVKLRPGCQLDPALRERIVAEIRQHATPRHVPAKIIAVADIPHTKSGKIVELAVRDCIHGLPVRNLEALANPEALELFREIAELRS